MVTRIIFEDPGFMSRKNKNKKSVLKSIIKGIAIAVIAGVILIILQPAMHFIWGKIISIFKDDKVNIAITELLISRKSYDKFPECEFSVFCQNPANANKSIIIKSIIFSFFNFRYTIPEGLFVINLAPISSNKSKFIFSDAVLDSVLLIPQNQYSLRIAIEYQQLGHKSSDWIELSDSQLTKCTFWQTPFFESQQQAKNMGAHRILFTRTTEIDSIGIIEFANEVDIPDLNLREMINNDLGNQLILTGDLNSFKRKYGGIYKGYLTNDKRQITFITPANFFGNKDEYELFKEFGISFEQDFSHILEFIHYSFSPAKLNPIFNILMDRGKYIILIIYEEEEGIAHIVNTLEAKDYKVGTVKVEAVDDFLENLVKLPTLDKIEGFVKNFNLNVDTINTIFANQGLLMFNPNPLDSTFLSTIRKDIELACKKQTIFTLTYDCSPIRETLLDAPFAIPILIYLNFSEVTRHLALDSLSYERIDSSGQDYVRLINVDHPDSSK